MTCSSSEERDFLCTAIRCAVISSSISKLGFGGSVAGTNESYVCSPDKFLRMKPDLGLLQIIEVL